MRIVLLENDKGLLFSLNETFQWHGIRTELAASAYEVDYSVAIDILILDHFLNGQTGLDVLKKVKEHWPKCRIVVLTGSDDAALIRDYLNAGAHKCILKGQIKYVQDLVQTVKDMMDGDKLNRWRKFAERLKQLIRWILK